MLDIADRRSTKSDLGRSQHSITRIGDADEVSAAFLLGLSLFYLPESDRKKRIARSGLTNLGGFCWLWCSVMVVLMMVLEINGPSPDRRFPDNSFFYVFTPNTYLSQNLDAIQWLTVSKIYPPNRACIVAALLRGERSGRVTGNR